MTHGMSRLATPFRWRVRVPRVQKSLLQGAGNSSVTGSSGFGCQPAGDAATYSSESSSVRVRLFLLWNGEKVFWASLSLLPSCHGSFSSYQIQRYPSSRIAKGSSVNDCGVSVWAISTAVYADWGLAVRRAKTASSGVGPAGFSFLNSSLDIGNLNLKSGDLCSLRNLSSHVLIKVDNTNRDTARRCWCFYGWHPRETK